MSGGRALLFAVALISLLMQLDCQIQKPSAAGPEQVGTEDSAVREEKLRSALIDAFQAIKSKGGVDGSLLNLDLIGSIGHRNNETRLRLFPNLDQSTTEDSFDRFFADDDGLTFAEAGFEEVEPVEIEPQTERAQNVQRILKTTRKPSTMEQVSTPPPRSTARPAETIITRISDSIRSAVNETRLQLQASAPPVRGDNIGIENLLRVFDAEILVEQWSSLRAATTSQACRRDMEEYVRALAEQRLWALKMDDASGRYTSAFYWGNNYWTGSAHLCSSLAEAPHARHTNMKNESAAIFADWREDTAMSDAGPPFRTAFYMLKMRLNSTVKTLIKKRRTIHLGLCLPYSCSPLEVETLVAAAKTPLLDADILSVRSDSHSAYNLLQDVIFQMLVGVSTLVFLLLTAGTWYDMHLSRRVRRARRRATNMAAAPEGVTAAALAADHKLDLNALENVNMTNGKAIYNVNNNVAVASNNSQERLTTDSAQEEELKLSIWSELLLSFSAKTNVLQILDQSVGSDTIPVVHGLRSLSMVWVILGHACIVAFKYADNTEVRKIVEKEFVFQIVVSAVYSVDTFFCLGGLLVSFLYFRSIAKGSLERLTMGKKNFTAGLFQFLGLIGYRFARLSAPYLFMLGVVQVTMKWFHYNSVFEPPTADHETCPKYWWRNILYINTLFPVEQMCMLWSWYLSDDSQFYALSAILLILATSHFKFAAGATGFFFLSSLLTTGYVSWANNHIPNSEDPFTSFDKIYDKPWTRLGPYLVGLVTGWILFKTNLNIRMSKVWVGVGWTASLSTLLFLIFGLYSVELDVISAAVYSSLSHTLWATSIAWIIIACSTGYGGWLHRMLSAPILYPFSRVTYCAYLVHPVVIRFVAMQLDHPLHLGKIITIVLFLGMAVISYALAFVVSVAFEAPIVTMLKILSPHKKPHKL